MGWTVQELSRWVEGSILQSVLLFEVLRFQNVYNKMDNISRERNQPV
jgi:hypothetical protein